MVLLSQNNVPRVKELVTVALKHQRSINYIVDKVVLAINKIYRARPSEEDKDLAFIVLKLGGPALLDILGKANKLPSSSVAPQLHIVWDPHLKASKVLSQQPLPFISLAQDI